MTGVDPDKGLGPMSQHFLLSASARTLSLSSIFRMTDDEARDTFKRIRWSANNSEPFCPHCGCLIVYMLTETPPRWKCSACRRKFSLTSGTLFHSRKLAVRDYLAVIALFVNGLKGTSALQISRDLNINPKSSFVLLHKLREAMGSQVHNPDEPELSGEVQVDRAYFGGHVKPENRKADRKDRRLAEEQTGKRQVVVVAREVKDRTMPFIVPRESDAVALIRQHVASGTIIHADESNAWERLHASYDVRRVTIAAFRSDRLWVEIGGEHAEHAVYVHQIGAVLVKLAFQLIDDAGEFAALGDQARDDRIARGHAALRCQ